MAHEPLKRVAYWSRHHDRAGNRLGPSSNPTCVCSKRPRGVAWDAVEQPFPPDGGNHQKDSKTAGCAGGAELFRCNRRNGKFSRDTLNGYDIIELTFCGRARQGSESQPFSTILQYTINEHNNNNSHNYGIIKY